MNQFDNEFEEANAPRIRCVQVGDLIKAPVAERDDPSDKHKQRHMATYRITEVHPFMARAVSVKRPIHNRCFTYGDLVILGKEKQEPHLEALRRFTMEDEQRTGRKPSRA